ncbi:hypothetical protein G5I_08789 [Acromyrmex echinatior]|uniref:Uncharacterized protein n=1 Tax=Acromyrmex echinatior TaxID=103372 RepID=F4WSF8_ACREC|nr:hypothetical protein G5I_08789 [Acromyrmex echinatior]
MNLYDRRQNKTALQQLYRSDSIEYTVGSKATTDNVSTITPPLKIHKIPESDYTWSENRLKAIAECNLPSRHIHRCNKIDVSADPVIVTRLRLQKKEESKTPYPDVYSFRLPSFCFHDDNRGAACRVSTAHGFRVCWLPEGGDAGRREVVVGQGGRERGEGRNGDGSRKREETESTESRKAKRSRSVGRRGGGVGGRRVRIGGGRVMGESVRRVARWYGNERFRGPVGGQAVGEEGGGGSSSSSSSNAARDRVGLVRRTPQRVT